MYVRTRGVNESTTHFQYHHIKMAAAPPGALTCDFCAGEAGSKINTEESSGETPFFHIYI